ncbi:MAG: hypothetical protein R6U46_14155 [Marinilabilia sp.]
MRTYSEIGCLTLLGVTLTVYAVAGDCRKDAFSFERSSQDVYTGAVSDDDEEKVWVKAGNHYFIAFHADVRKEHSFLSSGGHSLSELTSGEGDLFSLKVFYANPSFLVSSLFTFGDYSFDDKSMTSTADAAGYKNPSPSFAGEIRAGPHA